MLIQIARLIFLKRETDGIICQIKTTDSYFESNRSDFYPNVSFRGLHSQKKKVTKKCFDALYELHVGCTRKNVLCHNALYHNWLFTENTIKCKIWNLSSRRSNSILLGLVDISKFYMFHLLGGCYHLQVVQLSF